MDLLDSFFTMILPALMIIGLMGFVLWIGKKLLGVLYIGSLGVNFALIAFVIVPLGTRMAVDDVLTFHEHWDGSVVRYGIQVIGCTKDGPCLHEYKCDPYECNCRQVCDRKDEDGDCVSSHKECDTCYHDCPYCEFELTYTVGTNAEFPGSEFGPIVIAGNRLPENPHDHRWQPWRMEPLYPWIIEGAGVGPTTEWLQLAARLDEGNVIPWTGVAKYKNYIQGTDAANLAARSTSIEDLLKAGLIPPPPMGRMLDRFSADKTDVIGVTVDEAAWNSSLMRFNAVFGPELKGDMSLIIINDTLLKSAGVDSLTYIEAVRAYWQDPELHGRNTFAKNGVLVVIGTEDGQTVSWVRGITGMPVGNEDMINALERDMRLQLETLGSSTPLTPEAMLGTLQIIGAPNSNPPRDYMSPYSFEVETSVEHNGGYIEQILFGLRKTETAFERISMSAKDAEDVGLGFTDLESQVQIKAHQKRLIVFVSVLVGMFILIAASYVSSKA